MPIAEKMKPMVSSFETIKTMFEEGARLKTEHGADKVYDFSLGNPDVPPPAAVRMTGFESPPPTGASPHR
jgi:aspartate aminotransferase